MKTMVKIMCKIQAISITETKAKYELPTFYV